MTAPGQRALVDPGWLAEHLHDPDVRVVEIAGLGQEEKQQAYSAGHIPGADCWEWKSTLWDSHARDFPAPEEFARRLGQAGIGNETTVVFYGEPVQFGIYAWWTFMYCGHRNVKVLDGARYRWQAEGRPFTADIPPARPPVTYRPVERDERMRIGRDDVLAALGDTGKVILDGRSREEYSGQRVGVPGHPDVGALRAGRIPGAMHLMFEDLLDSDKRFKPVEDVRAAVEARGAGAAQEVIAYCRMSHRATVIYFALTEILGYDKVRVYDGSWTEWGNLVGVPVER